MRVELTADLNFQSSLFFGASRAGKTRLCATFPRPVFLCSRREKGFVTIAHMENPDFYEPGVKPIVFAVDTIGEAMGHLHKDVAPLIQRGLCKTIVVELTFHADDVLRTADVDDRNGWAKYMAVEQHVHHVDMFVKRTPGVRAVYNTLAMPEDQAKGTSGVLLPGKALAKKIPALCDLSGYLRQEEVEDRIDRVLHLAAYGTYSPGHRYGKKLPAFVRNPTFKILEDLLAGRATVDETGTAVYPTTKVVSMPSLKPLGK